MLQVKLFSGQEDAKAELEAEVNTWIAESGAEIVSIAGNMSPQTLLPTTDANSTLSGSGSPARRFAPSDILVVVTYNKG